MWKFIREIILLTCMLDLSTSSPPKTVNLPLDSSFLFEPDDIQNNLAVLDNIKTFIDQLKSTLEDNSPDFRKNTEDKINFRQTVKKEAITHFLTEIGSIIMNYDKQNLKQFTKYLKEIVLNKLDHECNVTAVIDDNIKIFLRQAVDDWDRKDHLRFKLEIAKHVINTQDKIVVNFFRYLNKHFNDSDVEKLNKITRMFEKENANEYIEDALKNAIQTIVFDKISTADERSLADAVDEMHKLGNYLKYRYIRKEEKPNENINRRSVNDTSTVANLANSTKVA